MKITMLETKRVSEDGHRVRLLCAGNTYDVAEGAAQAVMAEGYAIKAPDDDALAAQCRDATKYLSNVARLMDLISAIVHKIREDYPDRMPSASGCDEMALNAQRAIVDAMRDKIEEAEDFIIRYSDRPKEEKNMGGLFADAQTGF